MVRGKCDEMCIYYRFFRQKIISFCNKITLKVSPTLNKLENLIANFKIKLQVYNYGGYCYTIKVLVDSLVT